MERVLGRVRGGAPGPTLITVGGLHGNESAGILALARVLEALSGRDSDLSGEFFALSGNRGALALGRRFLGRDLNRLWIPERIEAALASKPLPHPNGSPVHPEDAEQLDLLRTLEDVVGEAQGDVFFLDLHTTSGPGEPFTTIADSERSRPFARNLPVPLILGLAEMLEGTLAGYMSRLGIPAAVFEGGQHGSPESVLSSEAAVWITLAATGIIRETAFPMVAQSWEHLRTATQGLPPVLEMKYRHPVSPEDRFSMLPGFRSFEAVKAGQVLANDREGKVPSPKAGLLLLPLYQPQGEDGFFLIEEVLP